MEKVFYKFYEILDHMLFHVKLTQDWRLYNEREGIFGLSVVM